MPYLILSAGRDPVLLKKRNSVLTANGYQIAAASDCYEVVEKLLNGNFDLVLLCNSMPEEDRRRLARIIGLYTPSTPVVLISEGPNEEQAQLGGRTVQCSPEQLLQVVTGSLRGGSGIHAA
jgi:CheY-like chemotaxis protein